MQVRLTSQRGGAQSKLSQGAPSIQNPEQLGMQFCKVNLCLATRIDPPALNLQISTFNHQPSTLKLQPPPLCISFRLLVWENLRSVSPVPSTLDIEPSTLDLELPWTLGIRQLELQPWTLELQRLDRGPIWTDLDLGPTQGSSSFCSPAPPAASPRIPGVCTHGFTPQSSTLNLQPSNLNLQNFNHQPSTFNLQPPTFSP